MTRRERAAFQRVTSTVVAPAPPLPPVHETDAADAFERLLDASPPANRVALRAAVLALGRVNEPHREQALRTPLGDAIRATAAMTYYGDANVQRLLGYDP